MVATSGRLDLANKLFRGAVSINSQNVAALSNIGTLLAKNGKLVEAQQFLARAIALSPKTALAWAMLATVYSNLNDFLSARQCLGRALELDPNQPDYWYNAAAQAQFAGDLDKSEECYQKALALRPDDPAVKYSWAMIRLLRNDFDFGLPLYESRLQEKSPSIPQGVESALQIFSGWKDSEADCDQIIVEAEQGIGDLFMMARYAPWLNETFPNAVVILHCQEKLVPIMKRFDGFDDVVSLDEQIKKEDFSFSIGAMSLMYLFRLYGNAIYLPPAKINTDGLPETEWSIEPKFKIGVCWKGSAGHALDRFRSIPVKDFFKFGLDAPDAVFPYVNLQYDAERDSEFNGYAMTRGHIDGWENTLATISRLDLVISCDTATAHLAGSIGKPTWLLLAAFPDWRWLTSGEKTAWYDSVTLFRQEKLLDWAPVISEVRARLGKMIGAS